MTKHFRSSSFSLLTGNEAPQDALLSTESIEVRPLVPKGILSVRPVSYTHLDVYKRQVDEYAVTDKNGLAKFENVLISGDTPYVVEEVDTAVRYVVPASQTAPIEWNKVTKRSFDNVLKKFQVTVTKTEMCIRDSPGGQQCHAGFY